MRHLLMTLSVLGSFMAVSAHGAAATSVPPVSRGGTAPGSARHVVQYYYGAPYPYRYYYCPFGPDWRAREWRREQHWRWRWHEYWRHRRWRCWNFGDCY